MNVLIIGFGAAGKYYHQLLKKNKKVKKILQNLIKKNYSKIKLLMQLYLLHLFYTINILKFL